MAEGFLTPLSLLAEIVKTAPDALVVVDGSGRILFANEQTERLFSCPREDLMGEPVEAVLPEPPEPVGGAMASLDEFPRYALTRDGGRIPVEVRTSSVPFEGGELEAISIRDVSERQQAEREARRLREQLAHVGRVSVLGELVTSMAHEINQPLAAILSNAQAGQRFLDRPEPLLEEVSSALADVVAQSRRAGDVVSHLRSMVRRQLRDPVRLEIGDLLTDLEPLLRKDAEERGIDLVVDIAPDAPIVKGDRIQLQQVVLNLVLNAFDAVDQVETDARRVLVRMGADDGGMALIEVHDNGVGLAKGEEQSVFDAFVTTKEHGLGVGLSISRTVVEIHGGSIEAENNSRGGATFRVALPAA